MCRFSLPIGTESQNVDRALLAHPKPIGLRGSMFTLNPKP